MSKSWGTVTKFEHFLQEDDLVIDSELIDLKAKLLLEHGDFYNVTNYKKIIAHLESLRSPPEKEDEGLKELEILLRVRSSIKEIIKEEYKNLLSGLAPQLKDQDLEKRLAMFMSVIIEKINNF
jgi:hypothetical protein